MKSVKFVYLLAGLFLSNTIAAIEASQYKLSDWEQWRVEYEKTVVGKGGWLSLAGLYWLTDGDNTLGSDKSNTHRFPAKAPGQVGTIQVKGNTATMLTSNNNVFIDSKAFNKAELSVKDKTLVTFGDFEFYLIQREIGFAIRLIDNQSKKVKLFKGTQFTPFNQNWVLPAKLIRHESPQTLKIPTVYGTTREDTSAGWLEFEVNGQTQRLQAVDYGKDSLMYVMFADATSGDTTYGAGRYIEVEWPDENGNTFIDFNRAYNPACAFTNYATCPLTPRQNRLKVAINAGELDVVK